MRFHRHQRHAFVATDRKRAEVARSNQRKVDKLPLLGPLIAETLEHDPDVVMAQRAEAWERSQQRTRDKKAEDWRRARGLLYAFPAEDRAALLRFWNSHRWFPGDPGYLLGVLHSFWKGDYIREGDRILTSADVEWRAKIQGMSDEELLRRIQETHFDGYREQLRAERNRRLAAQMEKS